MTETITRGVNAMMNDLKVQIRVAKESLQQLLERQNEILSFDPNNHQAKQNRDLAQEALTALEEIE